jgi:tetratricopeptide (TPR) repeat protein/TolB-like protein/predicted Ser/Thr protein kinase
VPARAKPPASEAEAAHLCPQCGAHNPDAALTCSHCGGALVDSNAETAISSRAPVPATSPEPAPTVASSASAMTADGSSPPQLYSAQPQAQSSPPSNRVPDFGPRYRVECILGEGGMGTVYKAWDKELERTVALKLVRRDLTRDPSISQRFKQELLLASKISHRNVLRIHDLGDGPGDTKFISMAYVEGQDLSHLLRKEGKLPLDRALNIARQLAAALDAAHTEGVVHRDLKPQNILIDQHDHIYVSDFGLAKSLESDLGMTQTGQFLGTPRYMSPEQAEIRPVDHRSDLYAFGLILCEMVTGNLPFEPTQSTMQMMYQRVHGAAKDPRRLNPDLPECLARIIQKCLERDVNLRYQSAAEIIADLDAGHAPHLTHRSWVATAITLAGGRPKKMWLAAAAGLALLVVGLAVWRTLATHTAQPATNAGAAAQVSLAIVPFRNASGDASLDWLGSSLVEILSTDVGQSAQLRTVSPNRLHQIFSDLKISPTTILDPPTIVRIAEFTSADRVVWGQYARFGDQIRIDATIQDIKRGQTATLAVSATENNVLAAVDRLAGDIRSNLAFSRSIVKELAQQSFKPSTSSLPAMRDYNDGLESARNGNFLDAARRFEASTKEDPRFALAYSELAKAYADLGQDNEAEQAAQKAVALSDQLPSQEKYLIQASFDRIQKDYPKAIEAYDNLAKAAPGNADVLLELGGLYENSSAYEKARDAYTQVLALDPKRVDALVAMGRVEIYDGNPEKALEYLTRAQALTVEFGNDEERADILQATGVAYADLNKHQDALRNLRDSLEIKRRLGLKKGVAMSLDAMATSEDVLGKPEQALKDYKEALALWRELGDKAGTGDVLIDLAQFYVDHGQYDQGLKLFKESLQAEIDAGNQNNQGLVLNNIGNAYFMKGDYQNARTYFEQALQLREALKVPSKIADTLHNLADTSTEMGQYDLAIEQYLRALDLRRSTGDKRSAAIESSSIGILFGYQGRYGASLSSEEDAVKTFREVQDPTWLAEVLGYYGHALAQIGRNDDAQKSLEEALNVARGLKNDATTAEILGYQGDNAFYRAEYKSAASLYDEALKTASHTSDLGLILVSKFNVAKAAVGLDRFQLAASVLGKLSEEADSMGSKYVSAECSIYHAEALMNLKSYEPARKELESALSRSQKLGLRVLLAQTHYLLARDLELSGKAADAPEHYQQARQILDEIKSEAKTDSIVKRSDLSPIYTHPAS